MSFERTGSKVSGIMDDKDEIASENGALREVPRASPYEKDLGNWLLE